MITLPPRQDGYKVPYATTIKGSAAVRLMTLTRAHMSRSRQQQIDKSDPVVARSTSAPRAALAAERVRSSICDASCEVPWLAGLLEGEGCFTITWNAGRGYPVIMSKM